MSRIVKVLFIVIVGSMAHGDAALTTGRTVFPPAKHEQIIAYKGNVIEINGVEEEPELEESSKVIYKCKKPVADGYVVSAMTRIDLKEIKNSCLSDIDGLLNEIYENVMLVNGSLNEDSAKVLHTAVMKVVNPLFDESVQVRGIDVSKVDPESKKLCQLINKCDDLLADYSLGPEFLMFLKTWHFETTSMGITADDSFIQQLKKFLANDAATVILKRFREIISENHQ